MNLISSIGKAMVKRGEAALMKQYEKQYGRQIGKVSESGRKAFLKSDGLKEVITGLDKDGNVISKITRDVKNVNKHIGSGTIHTERYKDGKLTQISDTRLDTNYRKTLTHYPDGSATLRVWDCPMGSLANLKIVDIPSVYSKNASDVVYNSKAFLI